MADSAGDKSGRKSKRHRRIRGNETRVDGAHPLRTQPSVELVPAAMALPAHIPSAQAAAEAGESDAPGWANARELLTKQARQLASHLRRRQQQLDRREAELHTQMAALENQDRTNRLWFQERQQELEDREVQLALSTREIDTRRESATAAIDAERASHDRLSRTAIERERQLAEREWAIADAETRHQAAVAAAQAALDERQAELETLAADLLEARQNGQAQQAAAAAFTRQATDEATRTRRQLADDEKAHEARKQERERDLEDQAHALSQRASQLDQRQARLDETEALLDRGRHDFEEARRAWIAEQKSRDSQSSPPAIQSDHDPKPELEAQRVYIDRQRRELDTERGTLEALRVELQQTYQETLELRLATEELWAQMTARLPAGVLGRALAETRRRIADEYARAEREVTEARQELAATEQRLAEQFNNLSQQRAELESWLAQRKAEVTAENSRLALVGSQHELREQRYQDRLTQWQAERAAYESQIRRLLLQLREHEAVSAAA